MERVVEVDERITVEQPLIRLDVIEHCILFDAAKCVEHHSIFVGWDNWDF